MKLDPLFELMSVAVGVVRDLFRVTTWRIAWRNVWRNPRRTFIVITAVTVGLAGLGLAMAVNYGMVVQMVETVIRTELGHVQVHAQGFDRDPSLERRLFNGGRPGVDVLDALDSVDVWAPRVRSEALVFSPRASAGVRLVAVDPSKERDVTLVAESMVDGSYLSDTTRRRALLGEALARRLQVKIGDKIVVSAQDVTGDLTGEAFRVGGLFRTASSEFDRGTLFVQLAEGQKLLAMDDSVSELVALAKQRSQIDAIKLALMERLGDDFEVRTWEELQPFLVYMIDMMDQMSWWVYGAIFVAMAFGIANVLLMAIHERIREIGIVMAIGMKPDRLVAMILVESMLLIFIGVALGLAGAWASVASLQDGIDLSRWAEGLTAFGIGTRIVPVLRSADLLIPVVVAALTGFVASLWPALRAVRFRPAEAVRHV